MCSPVTKKTGFSRVPVYGPLITGKDIGRVSDGLNIIG